MIYIALDTCVWLELLKTDFNKEDNHFEELLYWIENDYITCIVTENLLNEWNRHKVTKKSEIIHAFTLLGREFSELLSATHEMDSIYPPDKIKLALESRIERLDLLFSSKVEVANESASIYLEASKRCLDCIAPNHQKDSFRDTVNILTLKNYVIEKGYQKCIFTTINYKDFSADGRKYDLHNQLTKDFEVGNLEYVYFDITRSNFAGKLFNLNLRPLLPKFTEYLKVQKAKFEERKILEKKIERELLGEPLEPEYLDDTMQIDRIINSGKRTELDEQILKILFNKNPIYMNYFTKKLAENGLV
jgi:hypothetical protein